MPWSSSWSPSWSSMASMVNCKWENYRYSQNKCENHFWWTHKIEHEHRTFITVILLQSNGGIKPRNNHYKILYSFKRVAESAFHQWACLLVSFDTFTDSTPQKCEYSGSFIWIFQIKNTEIESVDAVSEVQIETFNWSYDEC